MNTLINYRSPGPAARPGAVPGPFQKAPGAERERERGGTGPGPRIKRHRSGPGSGTGAGLRAMALSLSLLALLALGARRRCCPPGSSESCQLRAAAWWTRRWSGRCRACAGCRSCCSAATAGTRSCCAPCSRRSAARRKRCSWRGRRSGSCRRSAQRCNASVQALWESCKPCLRQRCLRFYSRTCRSGAGLVGRQLEEFLNHSSPISIWVDGERLDSLLERDERQERQLQDLEERFGLMEDGVQDIFLDSSRVQDRLHPFFQVPFGGFREALGPPVQRLRLPRRSRRFSGDFFPFFPHRHGGFQQLFQPLFQITQRMLEDAQGSWENPTGEFGTESRNFSNDRMVCREIRRNSAGCLRMRDECDQCREILALDCGQEDPSQQELREQLEDAVRVAERFTRRYDSLLREFQEEMLNTSGLLDQLNRQFGWVSRLANHSMGSDGFLQVTTVLSKAPNPADPSVPPDTQVTVQLFDSEPLALTVPGDIPWDDPRFMENVAQQALQRFKENAVE
uniref:Clusterin n=1 Tax=Geospiza parvula TaxID=87175 RepID=A0A8C3NHC3_GEOPR